MPSHLLIARPTFQCPAPLPATNPHITTPRHRKNLGCAELRFLLVVQLNRLAGASEVSALSTTREGARQTGA